MVVLPYKKLFPFLCMRTTLLLILRDLEATINKTECDSVVIGTPIDLNRIIKIDKPNTRVYYDLQEIGEPDLKQIVDQFIAKHNLK